MSTPAEIADMIAAWEASQAIRVADAIATGTILRIEGAHTTVEVERSGDALLVREGDLRLLTNDERKTFNRWARGINRTYNLDGTVETRPF